jgi:hypothetical protein
VIASNDARKRTEQNGADPDARSVARRIESARPRVRGHDSSLRGEGMRERGTAEPACRRCEGMRWVSDALVINDILLRATPSVGDTKAASAEKART